MVEIAQNDIRLLLGFPLFDPRIECFALCQQRLATGLVGAKFPGTTRF